MPRNETDKATWSRIQELGGLDNLEQLSAPKELSTPEGRLSWQARTGLSFWELIARHLSGDPGDFEPHIPDRWTDSHPDDLRSRFRIDDATYLEMTTFPSMPYGEGFVDEDTGYDSESCGFTSVKEVSIPAQREG